MSHDPFNDDIDPGDPDYLGQLEEDRFHRLQEEDPEFLERQAQATEERIAASMHAVGTTPDQAEPVGDEITAAREIIESHTNVIGGSITEERGKGFFGAMTALHRGHTRFAVSAALVGVCRDTIVDGIRDDLDDTAVDEEDHQALDKRASEIADQHGGEYAGRIMKATKEAMPALQAYAAIRPHVNVPNDDRAAGDYAAAKACLSAGHDKLEVARALCVHGEYGAAGRSYAWQIVQAADKANQPKAQAEPGQATPRPRAPW